MDDKCPACGEWTETAFAEYGGLYNDGSEMDCCECGYSEDDEGAAWAEIAWDLGVSLPAGHPFAPVVDGRQAA